MRRFSRGFAVGLLLLLVVVPGVGAVPRHLDPLLFGWQSPPPGSLFDLYGLVFNATSLEDFAGAEGWLGWADVVNVPPGLVALLGRYNGLLRLEVRGLNSTSVDLASARAFIQRLDEEEAREALRLAREYLTEANATLVGVDSASRLLASALKASPGPLVNGTARFAELIKLYSEQINELLRELELPPFNPEDPFNPNDPFNPVDPSNPVHRFIPTFIDVELSPVRALIGTRVQVKGRLVDVNGTGLPGRSVDVLLDGDWVLSAVTGEGGVFAASLHVPYIYVSRVLVSAEYWPVGDDFSRYLPSASDDAVLELIYYAPEVSVELPATVLPGKSMAITGAVTVGTDPVPGLSLRVDAFDSTYFAVSDAGGVYSLSATVPGGTPEGEVTISVRCLPDGVYGPAGVEAATRVVRLPLKLEVDAPGWIITGSKVRVTGRVSVGGVPLGNCSVTLRTGAGVALAISSVDSSFSADVDFPLNFATSNMPYQAVAVPAEPWIRAASASGEIFVANVLTLVGGPVLVGAVGVYTYRRFGRRPRRGKVGLVVAPTVGGQSAVVEVAEGEKGADGLYSDALRLVEDRTGVGMEPSMTLREYLYAVRDRLGGAARVFSGLTILYERWLYDPADRPGVGVFKRLVVKIRRVLGLEG